MAPNTERVACNKPFASECLETWAEAGPRGGLIKAAKVSLFVLC